MKNWYLMQINKGIWQKRNKGKISEKIYFLIKIIIINIIFVIIINYKEINILKIYLINKIFLNNIFLKF